MKSSVDAYGEYEQLVGGIETLFGAGGKSLEEYAQSIGSTVDEARGKYNELMTAQSDMMRNAAEAFKTAGLSANDYMNTAIGFSGALLKSVSGDTVKAAKLTDTAIQDMADQANKYGKTVEEISATYTSLARGNTQTLDNLFGGMFAGTKDGLKEMLKYAEDYRASMGETVSYSVDSYADIVSAIHDVSRATGVYGTTADEAAGTIQGSTNMMKAAWQNLVIGVANDAADFDKLINDLVESATAFAGNIMPRIATALSGVGKLVTGLAPQISAALPALITDVVPSLIESAAQLVMTLGQGIVENLPLLVGAALDVILALANGISDNLPQLIPTIIDVVIQIASTILSNLPMLINAGIEIVKAVAIGIVNYLAALIQPAYDAVTTFLSGISARIGEVINKGREILQSVKQGIANGISSLLEVGMNIVRGIWNGISNGLGWIKDKITGWVGNVVSFIKGLFGIHSPSAVMRDQVGVFLAKGIGVGFQNEMENVEKMMQDSMPDLTADVTFGSRGYATRSAEGGLVAEVAALREDLKNMRIYLDTGVLVGAMDRGLGSESMATRRRALA